MGGSLKYQTAALLDPVYSTRVFLDIDHPVWHTRRATHERLHQHAWVSEGIIFSLDRWAKDG